MCVWGGGGGGACACVCLFLCVCAIVARAHHSTVPKNDSVFAGVLH